MLHELGTLPLDVLQRRIRQEVESRLDMDAFQANWLIHMDAGVSRSIRLVKPDGPQTKAVGPRTERIVARILELGERLEEPDKGQLLIDFAGLTVKIRLTVVVPGDP